MSNINNQGVLFQSINPIDQTAYIALSNSWFNIYKNAADKLREQWYAQDPKDLKEKLGPESYLHYNYWFEDLTYYQSKIEQLEFEDYKSLRLYKVSNTTNAPYDFAGEFFSAIYGQILRIINSRTHDDKFKEILPKINFPIVRFRRAEIGDFIYRQKQPSDVQVSLLVKQFDQVKTVVGRNTFTPNNTFIKQRDYSALDDNLNIVLHKNHLTDLTAVINHLIDTKHISSNNFEETIERIIDDNLGLIAKLRPEFPIRPALAKKVLLSKLI